MTLKNIIKLIIWTKYFQNEFITMQFLIFSDIIKIWLFSSWMTCLVIVANEEFIAVTDIDSFKINCGVQSSSEQDVVSMETHLMFVTFCGNENPTKT